MAEEKMTVVIDGYTIEYTMSDDLLDVDNDPFLKKKLSDIKDFLRKHPHPWITGENTVVDNEK